jgi:hypothetical protein
VRNDPIVAEIHGIRERLLADCQDDLDKLLDRYQLAEARDADRVITIEKVGERRAERQGRARIRQ